MIGEKPAEHQMSIFEVALESFIDMNHEPVLLSKQIDRSYAEGGVDRPWVLWKETDWKHGNKYPVIQFPGTEPLPETKGPEEVL